MTDRSGRARQLQEYLMSLLCALHLGIYNNDDNVALFFNSLRNSEKSGENVLQGLLADLLHLQGLLVEHMARNIEPCQLCRVLHSQVLGRLPDRLRGRLSLLYPSVGAVAAILQMPKLNWVRLIGKPSGSAPYCNDRPQMDPERSLSHRKRLAVFSLESQEGGQMHCATI